MPGDRLDKKEEGRNIFSIEERKKRMDRKVKKAWKRKDSGGLSGTSLTWYPFLLWQ